MDLLKYYKGKKVLVTGHTGFKGSWLCEILYLAGADITGYSLNPPTEENLYMQLGIEKKVHSIIGDVRDYKHLQKVFESVKPEFVFHLAAQPIVRESYTCPRETYEINVMGTVNVMECVRRTKSVRSVINVTTDKVYFNDERNIAFTEDERLAGYDPYSNSKSCSELVTNCYKDCFFNHETKVAISTVRAGNVIGGGDYAKDRIVPDCVRAAKKKESIVLRNPNSIRPYQHVLEPLFVYLNIAMRQNENFKLAGNYNVGPDECDCITTQRLAEHFCEDWGEGMNYVINSDVKAPHEATFLRLNCDKLKNTIGWKTTWYIDKAIRMTVEWYKAILNGKNVTEITDKQIALYVKERENDEVK